MPSSLRSPTIFWHCIRLSPAWVLLLLEALPTGIVWLAAPASWLLMTCLLAVWDVFVLASLSVSRA